jgi:hypothetical protein
VAAGRISEPLGEPARVGRIGSPLARKSWPTTVAVWALSSLNRTKIDAPNEAGNRVQQSSLRARDRLLR